MRKMARTHGIPAPTTCRGHRRPASACTFTCPHRMCTPSQLATPLHPATIRPSDCVMYVCGVDYNNNQILQSQYEYLGAPYDDCVTCNGVACNAVLPNGVYAKAPSYYYPDDYDKQVSMVWAFAGLECARE